MSIEETAQGQATELYSAGRRDGLAVAAMVLGLVTFLSMLGAEKAIAAIVLGAVAMRGAPRRSLARRLGIASVVLGAVFIVTMAVVFVVFREQVATLIAALEKLS
jgi:hypothetical protein